MPAKTTGALLVGLASMLWATDALFRFPTVQQLDPVFIVWAEHGVALIPLTLWTVFRIGKKAFALRAREWISAFLIGSGGSAIATLMFTSAFRYLNPSVIILLQKLQPVIVVLLAYFFLGEKPHRKFFIWALLAFFAAIWLVFPDLQFKYVFDEFDLRSVGVGLTLGAALLWAVSTIAGKMLLRNVSPDLTTFWRFIFGFLTLGAFLLMRSNGTAGQGVLFQGLQTDLVVSLIYMGLVPGLLAMVTYYQGLTRTSASAATFMELLFPIAAVILNAAILKLPLQAPQIIAAIVLLFSVTMISLQGPDPEDQGSS